ncbi:MAG: hypothetical protein D8M59_09740 [Planctomycetes bacterium]|nr:hypothetical protein [Planctomycetota bacterium]NOG53460.1 hypothetical protein [Planctomycetota bacterium]
MNITARRDNKVIRSIQERDRYLEDRLPALHQATESGPIAVYGAGKHTAHLFEHFGALLPAVAFVLDDNPEAWGQLIEGVRICDPGTARPEEVTAVVVSSDAAEAVLAARAQEWVGQIEEPARRPSVCRLYDGCEFAYEKRVRKGQRKRRHHKLGPFYGAHRLEPTFNALYDEGLESADVGDNEWRRARFYNLINLLKLTAGLDGFTAEAGCFRGQSSYLICRTRAEQEAGDPFDGSTHVIVDSFEGLSEPTQPDGSFSAKLYEAGAFANTSVEHVRGALRAFPGVRIHKGWIPAVLGELEDVPYRFVHVDVDLYEPVKDCLEYFYARLVAGGVIVVDDHGPVPNGSYPGCAIACQEFSARVGVPFAPLSAGNAVFVKRG